ncbi:MAG: site-specific integrase [Mariniphaga sp.]|nr:site-specific integrase [Mariniphaga sp.]
MATIKFFLQSSKNPATINISLSTGYKSVFKRKTGYVIDPEKWSLETNLPKKGGDPEQKNLKTDLQNLATTIEAKLNEATTKGIDISGDWLQQEIDKFQGKVRTTDADRLINCIQDYIEYLPIKEYPEKKKRGASLSTVKKYKTLKIKIDEFEKYRKKKIVVKDVGPKLINELDNYFLNIDKLGRNTTGRYLRFVKTVCVWAELENNIPAHPQLKKVKGYTGEADRLFLTIDELELIENTTYKRSALENAKDWLIIGCYIGQRVSDLLILTDENITARNGIELLELTQQKTKKRVAIPLHPKVKTILNKRNGKFPYYISDVKFNLHIKDVCKEAGITEPIEGGKMVTDEKTKMTRKEFGTYPKHELITSHVCRRSFASNFYGEIPTPLLMNITAHSTEKQFLEYIGKSSNDYAIQLAEYWSKESLKANKEPQMTVIKPAVNQ